LNHADYAAIAIAHVATQVTPFSERKQIHFEVLGQAPIAVRTRSIVVLGSIGEIT
jgi:hypothetical protein